MKITACCSSIQDMIKLQMFKAGALNPQVLSCSRYRNWSPVLETMLEPGMSCKPTIRWGLLLLRQKILHYGRRISLGQRQCRRRGRSFAVLLMTILISSGSSNCMSWDHLIFSWHHRPCQCLLFIIIIIISSSSSLQVEARMKTLGPANLISVQEAFLVLPPPQA